MKKINFYSGLAGLMIGVSGMTYSLSDGRSEEARKASYIESILSEASLSDFEDQRFVRDFDFLVKQYKALISNNVIKEEVEEEKRRVYCLMASCFLSLVSLVIVVSGIEPIKGFLQQ